MRNFWRPLKLQKLTKALAICSATLAASCESAPKGEPLKSLCILDFKAQVCWVDKEKSEGFKFSEMNDCPFTGCWFGIDETDLKRIQSGLNK